MNPSAVSHCEAAAFESRYRESDDPWNFASSAYEQNRYAMTLQALARHRYRRAFEPGCSIGALTAQLAPLCEELVATDVSPTALARAQERCAEFNHVRFVEAGLESAEPAGPFDLIVLSEIGYYFTPIALTLIAQRLASSLEADGELIAVHWLGHSKDHVLHGDEVHHTLMQCLPLKRRKSERYEGFRLDAWVRE